MKHDFYLKQNCPTLKLLSYGEVVKLLMKDFKSKYQTTIQVDSNKICVLHIK